MTTSSAEHLPSASNVITPKGTVWKDWEPYVVVPFWSPQPRREDDDEKDSEWSKTLPGYRPCPIASCLPEPTPLPTKELQIFVNKKLYRDASFESLVMVVVIRLVVEREQQAADRWEVLRKDVFYPTLPFQSDDDDSWLMEGWPLIQDWISWEACCRLYHVIYTHLHQITLPHPLTTYATDTLLNLSESEFKVAVEGMIRLKLIPESSSYNRLRVSQHLLDYIASVPVRRVGVLLQDPLTVDQDDHEKITLKQSCLPSAALELVASDSSTIQCHVIALYDYVSSRTSAASITVSSQPVSMTCSCPRCTYHQDPVQYCASILATTTLSQQLYPFSPTTTLSVIVGHSEGNLSAYHRMGRRIWKEQSGWMDDCPTLRGPDQRYSYSQCASTPGMSSTFHDDGLPSIVTRTISDPWTLLRP